MAGFWEDLFGLSDKPKKERRGPLTFPVSGFTIGAVRATGNAHQLLLDASIEPMKLVARHASGDHGLVDVAMRERNLWAQKDARYDVVSVYECGGQVVYVVTQQDAPETVVMSAQEYHFWAAQRR